MGEMLTGQLFHGSVHNLVRVTWSAFETAAPDLASAVASRYSSHPHHVLATLMRDGSPRTSGINVMIDEGTMWFGSMPGARKIADLERDPRVSVHSAPLDEHLTDGDARVDGVVHILDPTKVARWRPGTPPGDFFEIRISRVHLVTVVSERLVITMWSPDQGLRIVERS